MHRIHVGFWVSLLIISGAMAGCKGDDTPPKEGSTTTAGGSTANGETTSQEGNHPTDEPGPDAFNGPTTTTIASLTCAEGCNLTPWADTEIDDSIPPISFDPKQFTDTAIPHQYNLYHRVKFRMPDEWVDAIAYDWGIRDSLGLMARSNPSASAFIVAFGANDTGPDRKLDSATNILKELERNKLELAHVKVTNLGRITVGGRESITVEFEATVVTSCCEVYGITVVYPRAPEWKVLLTTLVKKTAGPEDQTLAKKMLSSIEDFNIVVTQ